MAIFHLRVKTFGRNEGRSAVAASAYRSASRMENDFDGVVHDYTKKRGVVYSEIMLPNYAPKEYCEREKLWNAVEMAEKSKDARLCREVEIALPVELPRAEQIKLVRNFVKDNFVSDGMCADINVHDPPYTDDRGVALRADGTPAADEAETLHRNPHAHILLTVRPIDPETGKWEAKTQAEYLCIKDGIEQAFTPEEFKLAQTEGWEKQYHYYKGKGKIWLTAAEGKALGLTRVEKTAKATRYGRQHPVAARWNAKDSVFDWRNRWEQTCNQALAAYGVEARIDARTYVAQEGEGLIPEYKLSKAQLEMQKKSERLAREGRATVRASYKAEINAEIKRYNQLIRKIHAEIKGFKKAVMDKISSARRKVEEFRSNVIVSEYKIRMIYRSVAANLKEEYVRVAACSEELETLEQKRKVLQEVFSNKEKELFACGILEVKRKSTLRKEIAEVQGQMEVLEERQAAALQKYGFFDMTRQELGRRKKELSFIGKLIQQEETERRKRSDNITAFRKESCNLSEEEKIAMESCDMVRQEYDRSIIESVKNGDNHYNGKCLEQSITETDRKLAQNKLTAAIHKEKHLHI